MLALELFSQKQSSKSCNLHLPRYENQRTVRMKSSVSPEFVQKNAKNEFLGIRENVQGVAEVSIWQVGKVICDLRALRKLRIDFPKPETNPALVSPIPKIGPTICNASAYGATCRARQDLVNSVRNHCSKAQLDFEKSKDQGHNRVGHIMIIRIL